MVIGHSNGGGFAVYANWAHGSKFTKAVALDYWAYAYSGTWIEDASIYNAAALPTIDMHVYANCASGFYYPPPAPPTPYPPISTIAVADAEAIFTTPSFWNSAGLSVLSPGGVTAGNTYGLPSMYPNYPTHAATTYPYIDFTWVGGASSFLFSVHGFDPSTGFCTADMLSMSVGGNPAYGTFHGASLGANSIHNDVPLYADVEADVLAWVTPPPPPPSPPPPAPSTTPGICGWEEYKHADYFHMFDDSPRDDCLQMHEAKKLVTSLRLTWSDRLFHTFDCEDDPEPKCLSLDESWNFFQRLWQLQGHPNCEIRYCGGRWDSPASKFRQLEQGYPESFLEGDSATFERLTALKAKVEALNPSREGAKEKGSMGKLNETRISVGSAQSKGNASLATLSCQKTCSQKMGIGGGPSRGPRN
jgi:hypothetical protein